MSLVPLSIVHPGGTREINAYRVQPARREWARTFEPSPERWSDHGIVVWGDGLELPAPVTVTATITAATLAAAFVLAYTVLSEAEAATEITTNEGTRAVQGVVESRLDVRGIDVELTLAFAPTGPRTEGT